MAIAKGFVRLMRSVLPGALACVVCVGCSETPYTVAPSRPPVAGSVSTMPTTMVEAVEEALQKAGEPCNKDEVCESGHCSNNVCCTKGECCRDAEDCSGNKKPGVCMDATSCSGMKPVATCERNQCGSKMADDDSACDSMVEANDCGLFKSVFCTGEVKQRAVQCETTCTGDDECDLGAHCQNGDCISNAIAGSQCTADNECQTGHCVAGMCCTGDNCCATDADCDQAKYGKPVTCDSPETCQGTSGVAVCQGGRCGTKLTDDDTACGATVTAHECEGGPSVQCAGGRDQMTPPACASGKMCSRDLDCERSSYCEAGTSRLAGGMCKPDVANAASCDRGEMCQSGHCGKTTTGTGFGAKTTGSCCSYDCCDKAALCPELDCSMSACK